MTTENSSINLLDYEGEVKVLLPASAIPLGSTVTKRTGSKPYTLSDGIRVFDDANRTPNNQSTRRKIEFGDGVRILVNNTDINVIPGDQVLAWVTTFEKLEDILLGESTRYDD